MNSREHLKHLIESGFPDDPRDGEDCLPALRELDQLLADCAHYFLGYGLEDQESKLYERLAQAGYGDK